jgi:predicted GIY-YIG superfamily endonuclease
MEYKCNICNKKYSSYQSLWIHNKKYHKNINNITYNNTNNISRQTTIQNQCEYCKKILSRYDSLKRHKQKCSQKHILLLNEHENLKKQIKQELIKQEIIKQEIIKQELIKENNTITSKSIIQNFINGKKTENIITVQNKKFKCSHCVESFDTPNELDTHLKTVCKPSIGYNNIYLFNIATYGANKYPKGGDIYIIQTDFDTKHYYKIGITNDLSKRLETHKCGIAHEPRVHAYFPIKNIKDADVVLKQKLKKYNIKREIYLCEDLNEIKQIIKLIQKEFDSEQVEIIPAIKQCDICECKYCNLIFPSKYELDTHNVNCLPYVLNNTIELDELQPKKQNKNQLRKIFNEQYINYISTYNKTSEHFNKLLNRIHCIDPILFHNKFPNKLDINYVINLWNNLLKDNSISNEKFVKLFIDYINKQKEIEL